MKKIKLFLLAIAITASYSLSAQVAVTNDGSSADGSAMLDVKSTDKGFLPPRMTQVQIEAIVDPANGLMVYNTDDCKYYVYRECNAIWLEVEFGSGIIGPSFINCGDLLTDYHNNRAYNTVQIYSQCWIAENLSSTKYNDGTDIPIVEDQTTWANLTEPAYCWYENNQAGYANNYGALYNWYTVNTGKLCPVGWHVPDQDEWYALRDYLGGWGDAGGKMKSTRTEPDPHPRWNSPNEGADNSSGFTGLPGGWRNNESTGVFWNLGESGEWWSSTDNAQTRPWSFSLHFSSSSLGSHYSYWQSGLSVRCVKD